MPGKNSFSEDQLFARPDTNILILDSIMALNLGNFIGQPVDTLLHHLPLSANVTKIIRGDNNAYTARRLWVIYDNWYWVQIVVTNFQYMNPYDISQTWDLSLFKKETIAWIFVNQGNNCVYGCWTNAYSD